MNREIKFRAWDKINETIIERVWVAPDGSWKDDRRDAGMITGENNELMQFTGLTDKNGKEIFEGDIVMAGEHIGDIQECKGCFEIYWKKGEPGKIDYVRNIEEQLEVIGNIYEGLYSGEKSDILDICQKELKDFKKDTKLAEKQE